MPERVAEKTLVDELLDRVVAVGRLTLGDLRDTLSHNDLKMHELELGELKRGDQLLRCDRHLDRSLDGVYRRGEVYLRALQKLSSVLFGTPVGRVITLYFMLPLLGSFAVLEGLQHMVGPLAHKLAGVHLHFASTRNLLGGAVILFGLLHVAPVRAAVWKVVRTIGRVVRWIAWDVPGTIWGARLVVRLRASWLGQWVFKPVIPTAIALLLTRHSPAKWIIAGSVFVLVVAITSTPWGRAVEERALDYAVRGGRHLRTRLLPAAVKWVLELFARGLDLLDRGIYRVDEWLRFRTGQSRVMLVVKGALGTIWFVITYFLRLYVDLFIEPTVNPVKHFPVVTVSAKLMIPFIPSLLGAVASATTPLFGATVARGFAGFTVLVIPGLAGFLVWELKENWKLYRETRPKTLRPFAIGTHGETMPGFLRPGFHSGTLPKTFARLRRATWRSDERAVAKQEEVLHHVEESIARFANRQLVSMLAEVAAFRANDMTLLGVAVTSNRIQLTLACPSVGPAAATICFDFEDNLLIASIPEPGWLALLGSDQREIFEVALAGFYKLSDTDVVREQVAAARAAAVAAAEPVSDVLDERALTALARRHAVLSREPLFWSVWSTTWQHIARNEPPLPVLAGPSLLPD